MTPDPVTPPADLEPARTAEDDAARRSARPAFVRAALALFLAVAGMVVASVLSANAEGESQARLIRLAGGAVLLVAGIVAVRSAATAVRKSTEHRLGPGRSTAVAMGITIVGYMLVVLTALPLFGVDLQGLLLGGALTGVALGIAAQQTLGNFFAGLLLLLIRPFAVDDEVVLKSALGEYEGVISDMGIFYLKIETENGQVALPNATVLASAIGPGARAAK